MSEKTSTDRKKKKVQQGSSTPDLSKEISNITAQLKSIFSFCEELKINMEQVKTNQSEIKSKLQNLEEKVLNKTINETKRDETIDNTLSTIKENFDKQLEHFETSIVSKVDKVHQTSDQVNKSLLTYAEKVSINLAGQNKTGKAVSELVEKVKTIKQNVEASETSKSEMQLREFKKNNLLLHKLPESRLENLSENYKEDVKSILDIIDPKKELKLSDFSEIRRIGEKNTKSSPRSILIKCNSSTVRNQILQLRNLIFTQNNVKHQIFLSPDRTKIEQAAHKKLIAELKDRKNSGETDIMVRNGKIVKKQQPFRFKLQDFWSCRIQNVNQPETSSASNV